MNFEIKCIKNQKRKIVKKAISCLYVLIFSDIYFGIFFSKKSVKKKIKPLCTIFYEKVTRYSEYFELYQVSILSNRRHT